MQPGDIPLAAGAVIAFVPVPFSYNPFVEPRPWWDKSTYTRLRLPQQRSKDPSVELEPRPFFLPLFTTFREHQFSETRSCKLCGIEGSSGASSSPEGCAPPLIARHSHFRCSDV